jgi:hypothetical protein
MTSQRPADVAAEAQLYLAAVASFRAEGREPHWRPEREAATPTICRSVK